MLRFTTQGGVVDLTTLVQFLRLLRYVPHGGGAGHGIEDDSPLSETRLWP